MKKQKSLTSNSAKKRKILLGTLIPIGIIGIALAVTLPLTLCHSWVSYKKLKVGDTIKKIVFTGMTTGINGSGEIGIEFEGGPSYAWLKELADPGNHIIGYHGFPLYTDTEGWLPTTESIGWDTASLTLHVVNSYLLPISNIAPSWSGGKSPLQTAHYYLS